MVRRINLEMLAHLKTMKLMDYSGVGLIGESLVGVGASQAIGMDSCLGYCQEILGGEEKAIDILLPEMEAFVSKHEVVLVCT